MIANSEGTEKEGRKKEGKKNTLRVKYAIIIALKGNNNGYCGWGMSVYRKGSRESHCSYFEQVCFVFSMIYRECLLVVNSSGYYSA